MENTHKEELLKRIQDIDNHTVIISIDNFLNTIDNLMNAVEPYEDNPYLDRMPQNGVLKINGDEESIDEQIVELNMQWLKYW